MSLYLLILWLFAADIANSQCQAKADSLRPPNILIAISDDQSYPHAGVYGSEFIRTPHFDRLAREGVLFTTAYAPSPSCSPSRAAILTGRNIWQLEEAGVHISLFPKKYSVFPELLERAGYHTGYTGKGWGPGNWQDGGWAHNPAGHPYYQHHTEPPAKGMSDINYAANFEEFLKEKQAGQPFYFWYGGTEPHRGYEYGSGLKAGKKLEDVEVPGFLLDDSLTRMDQLDYALEIEYFDHHLGLMLKLLEEAGELENTLVIVTSDNGMPFPRAKINLYEHGVHVPLVIYWGKNLQQGERLEVPVSLVDLMPTILEAAGLAIPETLSGKSLLPLMQGEQQEEEFREFVLFGKERHNYARADNMGYPIRGMRQGPYLYLHNFKPERWPSGDPPIYKDAELDKVSGKAILQKKEDNRLAQRLFELNVSKRPAEELYDVEKDPACLLNLADDPAYREVKNQLWQQMKTTLKAQGDPRILGKGDIFDSYPAFAPIRMKDKNGEGIFPGFSEIGQYNPAFQNEP